MFGFCTLSDCAFSDEPAFVAPGTNPAFAAFLADLTAERVWLLEIDAFSLASVSGLSAGFADAGISQAGFSSDAAAFVASKVTLRFSSNGYTTTPTDVPASTWYDSRLTNQIRLERRIVGRDGMGGLSSVFAECEIANADATLDNLTLNYSIDGRPARLYAGRAGDSFSNFGLVFGGVVQQVAYSFSSIRMSLSDGAAKLDVPIQKTAYLGTGGNEGGADLAGKPKPKCYGQVFNITPPLVDAANLIYQVHDGAISDVTAVYDRGILLARVGGAPAAGQYQPNVSNGTFKLGATPAGTVTADVLGDASLSGYVNQTHVIVLRILLQQAGLTDSDVNTTSFFALGTAAPAAVGIWIGAESRTCADVVDELLTAIGAFGGFARTGAFNVGIIALPSGTPAGSYSEEDIVDIQRQPLPASLEPLAWRTIVAYQKNYTPQTDLASGVTAAQRVFASQPIRVSKNEDLAILGRHLLAREYGPTPGLYANKADADAEALRLFTLWTTPRGIYKVKTRPPALLHDLGDVLQLTHRRFGFRNGASARILGHALNVASATEVEVTVLA